MPKLTEVEKAERTWLFKKGVSGNPNGRPKKGKAFAELIDKELLRLKQEMSQKDGSLRNVNGKQMLAITLVRLALFSEDEKIKLQAIEKIMDRIDGKPVQTVDMDASVEQTNISVFDNIDVSKLSTKQKENLEDVLKSMYSEKEGA